MVSDRVAILNKGKLIREGTVKELTEKKHEFSLELENKIDDDVYLTLASKFSFAHIKDGHYSALFTEITELNNLIDELRSKNICIKEIIQKKSTLEEMFVHLINQVDKENHK
jgi:ABC-type multidrug transport system ATPase subunit